jgi:hypothetical protein
MGCENFWEEVSLKDVKSEKQFVLTKNISLWFAGAISGESAEIILLNSSEKLLTSDSSVTLGANGAQIFFCARSDQFIPCEVRHAIN